MDLATLPRRPWNGVNPIFRICARRMVGVSNSSDLIPMDFTAWSVLEQKASSFRQSSLDPLKRSLKRLSDEISSEMIVRILKNFRKGLNACIEAKGAHFKRDLRHVM